MSARAVQCGHGLRFWLRQLSLAIAVVLMPLLMPSLPLLLLSAPASSLAAADDPYAAWHQGRLADAAQELAARARSDGRWSSWYDAGLAAQDAGDAGAAIACLLAAHRRAPARPEPLAQLRQRGAAIGPTWCEALGPLALAGAGWVGALAGLIGGSLCGLTLAGRLRREWGWSGGLVLLLVLVGAAAQWRDAQAPLAGVLRQSAIFDGRGACLALLPAGSLVRTSGTAWQGRQLVELEDGRRGLIAGCDLGDGR